MKFLLVLTLMAMPILVEAQNLPSNVPAPQAAGIPQVPSPKEPPMVPTQVGDSGAVQPPQDATQDADAQKKSSPADLLSGIIEDYTYVPGNKRDPFLPYEAIGNNGNVVGPVFPLQKFDLDQLKLVGVIWDVKSPKAMIIDPQGVGYVVKLNERIGRNSGYVARIRESEVVVVEKFRGNDGIVSYVTKLMKLTN